MNEMRLTDAQLEAGLRRILPTVAQAGLQARILGEVEATRQDRPLPTLLGRLTDADPVARRRAQLLVAAVLVAIGLAAAGVVGALLIDRLRNPIPGVTSNGFVVVSANPPYVGGGEHGDIYLVFEGGAARRIIGSDGDGIAQACPAFSPEGRRLAYGEARASGTVDNGHGSWPVGDRAVVVVDLNDRGDPSPPVMRVSVGAGQGPLACPRWSPTGRFVAFRVAAELWIAEPATGGTRVIPIRPERGWQQNDLAWSRDGSLLAVAEPAQIRVVRADGSVASVIGVKGGTPSWLSWTPDKRVVYQTTDYSTDGVSIDAVNPDGTHKVQLVATEPDVWFRSTTVSPDGARVALVHHENGCSIECRQDVPRVLTMDIDGSNIVEIAIPPQFYPDALQWSPDGKSLLFSSISGVVEVPLLSGAPLVVHSSGDLNMEWSPEEVTWQPVRR
jgi:hypothetical protein